MLVANRWRSWGGVIVLGVLVTVLGAAAPAASALYPQLYPGQNSGIVDGRSFTKALTTATLQFGFAPVPLTENVTSVFTATIVYDRANTSHLPTVQVAYANKATLAPVKGAVEVSPVTDPIQHLDQGHKLKGGGFALAWTWNVVPRQSGVLTLLLQIQPLIVVKGAAGAADLVVRNKPIPISVRVNPNRQAMDEVSLAAQALHITEPGTLTVGERAQVVASLPLKGHKSVVQADISLAQDQGSVPATIQSAGLSEGADQLVRRWWVTPAVPGPVDLLFTVNLSTLAGDKRLTAAVPLHLAVTAEPAAPSLWDRLEAPVLWLTPIVLLLGGLLGIRASLSRRRDGPDEPPVPPDMPL